MPNQCDTTAAPSLPALARCAADQFNARFHRRPQWLVAAPGRVNIIGEHTDYNGGFVLPMAIERWVVIAADTIRTGDHDGADQDHGPQRAVFYSTERGESATFKLDASLARGAPTWSNYVRGVAAGYLSRGFALPSFDAMIASTVPAGGGLSSSAALEVAAATLIEAMTGRSLPPLEKVLLCQRAEHEFAGTPCGIMDQFTSVMARRNHLLLLDCRSHEPTMTPLTDPNVAVLIIDSRVKHALSGDGGPSAYAQRRAQCEMAAKVLGVGALRDADMKMLDAARRRTDEVVYRRARHVIGEIARTIDAADAIGRGDWRRVGRLMYDSHRSLRDDFGVCCAELDLLVELARALGDAGGVIGSRMTGGGFGGCTVSLVRTGAVEPISQHIIRAYHDRTGIEPTAFVTRPAQGAQVLAVDDDDW